MVTPAAPLPPMGVTASLVGTTITLAWKPVIGATSYNIYWGNSQGTTTASTKLANTANTTYEHTGLSSGAAYYYIVTSNFVSGQELASTEVVGSVPSGLNSAREAEGNNSKVTANLIYINGGEMRGQISGAADADYYKFVSTGGNVAFTIAPATPVSTSPSFSDYIRATIVADDDTVIASNTLLESSKSVVIIGNTIAGGTYYLKVEAGSSSYFFQRDYVVTSEYVIMNREIEPNSDKLKATPLSLGSLAGEMRGQISSKNDLDYYKFVSTGGNIIFTITPSSTSVSSRSSSTNDFINVTFIDDNNITISSQPLYGTDKSLTLIGNTLAGGIYYLIFEAGSSSYYFQQDYIITSN